MELNRICTYKDSLLFSYVIIDKLPTYSSVRITFWWMLAHIQYPSWTLYGRSRLVVQHFKNLFQTLYSKLWIAFRIS